MANEGFLEDYIKFRKADLSKAERDEIYRHLALIVGSIHALPNGDSDNQEIYEEIKQLSPCLLKPFGRRDTVSGGKLVSDHLTKMRTQGKYGSVIPTYLAWLSKHHSDEAEKFYKHPLAVRIGLEFRAYEEEEQAQLETPEKSASNDAVSEVDFAVSHLVENASSGFVGREKTIGEIDHFIEARFAGQNAGLLIVTGPAGFGKTSIAAHWCDRARRDSDVALAIHFCSQSYPVTANLNEAMASLDRQICSVMRRSISSPRHAERLMNLLSSPPPDDQKLVVWLDGVDEVLGYFECFLPPKLGANICVVISARAENAEIPAYLEPFTTYPVAKSYNPFWIRLEKFTQQEVVSLLSAKAKGENAGDFDAEVLGLRIYVASENGYPLFTALLVDDVIRSVKEETELTDFGYPDFASYIAEELRRLKRHPDWGFYGEFFVLMACLYEAIPTNYHNDMLPDERKVLNVDDVSPAFRRWLHIYKTSPNGGTQMISFCHPKIRAAFADADKWATDLKRHDVLTMLPRVFGSDDHPLRHYWCKYYFHHLIVLGYMEHLRKRLNLFFIAKLSLNIGDAMMFAILHQALAAFLYKAFADDKRKANTRLYIRILNRFKFISWFFSTRRRKILKMRADIYELEILSPGMWGGLLTRFEMHFGNGSDLSVNLTKLAIKKAKRQIEKDRQRMRIGNS